VLFEFAFDPIFQAPDARDRIGKLSQARSIRDIEAAIGDLKGIKLETRPVVRVQL